ncbi:MAG TPA: phosphatidylglycerophosphatase A [Rhizomicrobium sp.]|jgi:phosphatidylglycerophosphatase A|nr:phosphatidylglycerophosphatase A [Rhizomicrobium sp.]
MDSPTTTRAAASIATLFGIGFSPKAPGTVASLVALPFAWGIAYFGGRFTLVMAAILALAVGSWACEHYVHGKDNQDPSECVIDELAGQWIICAFAPLGFLAYALCFVLFRLLDIYKPWPISFVERKVPGGLGVMTDDVAAALIGAIVIMALGHWDLI